MTAAFNLNLLARINRELDADFVLEQFEHVGQVQSRGAQRRDAPAVAAGANGHDSPGGDDGVFCRRRDDLDREQSQVLSRKKCRRSPGMRAFSARRSGSIRNGPSPRACSWRSRLMVVGGHPVPLDDRRSHPVGCSEPMIGESEAGFIGTSVKVRSRSMSKSGSRSTARSVSAPHLRRLPAHRAAGDRRYLTAFSVASPVVKKLSTKG